MASRKKGATMQRAKKGAIPQVSSGSRFLSTHMERTMKVFPVNESEILSLSSFNNLVTGFWSGASGLLLLGIGVMIDLAIEGQFAAGQLTESGKILLWILAPVLFVGGIMLGFCGFWAKGKRKTIWENIEAGCKEIIQ